MTHSISALDGMLWITALPRAAVGWLKDNLAEVRFERGANLIEQGSTDRDCFFLITGQVGVVMNGREIDTSGPGEPVGETALLYRVPRGGTVTALAPVRALVLRSVDFDQLASADVESARAIAQALIEHHAARTGRDLPPWQPPGARKGDSA